MPPTPAPHVLTGPQLPVHLQLGTGPVHSPVGGRLAGVGEQFWPGLECDVDAKGGRVSGLHHLLGDLSVLAPPEGVGDRRGRLG